MMYSARGQCLLRIRKTPGIFRVLPAKTTPGMGVLFGFFVFLEGSVSGALHQVQEHFIAELTDVSQKTAPGHAQMTISHLCRKHPRVVFFCMECFWPVKGEGGVCIRGVFQF